MPTHTCPVCQYRGVHEAAKACPQCGADLEVFDLLRRLDRNVAEASSPEESVWRFRWGAGVFLVLLLLVVSGLFLRTPSPPAYPDRSQEVASLQDQVQVIQHTLDSLEATQQGPFLFPYSVRPGESLRRIARHFYGIETRYTDIQRANAAGITDPARIQAGQTILIPLERP